MKVLLLTALLTLLPFSVTVADVKFETYNNESDVWMDFADSICIDTGWITEEYLNTLDVAVIDRPERASSLVYA